MTEDPRVTFCGEMFALPEKIAATAVMRYAKAEKSANTTASLLAQYDLLQQCILPEDWDRFEEIADTSRASGEDLWAVINDVFQLMADRPTLRSSDSSDGPQSIEPKSTPGSSTAVRDLFPGRPDLGIVPLRLATLAS
jgi:hypothetical protein